MCVRVSSFIFCLTSLCLQEAADDNSVYRNEVHHSPHQGRALHQVSTQRSCLLPGPITIADQMAEEAMKRGGSLSASTGRNISYPLSPMNGGYMRYVM
ncbi:BnaA06g17090D [Brassica napus]|uniref:BnaA06g17090D protein n=1 Tax=Brassica napus TaxID=3708 RepID=A0A078HHR4_BRANA|nr:BnaA06g17090D [Brassica napus]